MDVALLLVLPLVGGYYFTMLSQWVRYRAAREEGHRLYFRSAFYGAGLFIICFFARQLLLIVSENYRFFEAWLSFYVLQIVKDPDKMHQFPLAVLAMYTMLAGPAFAYATNLVRRREHYLRLALKFDDLERLFFESAHDEAALCFTMDSGKIYVGFVTSIFDPTRERKSVGILPLASGYRTEDGRIAFTTDYLIVYERIDEDDEVAMTTDDFELVLPTDKIRSCNKFDLRVYEMFSDQEHWSADWEPWGRRVRSKAWARG
jgi:hypothetical protein